MPEFSAIDHAARVAAMRTMLSSGELGVDAIIVTDLTDIRWLTGFTGSNAWTVLRSDGVVLGTDTRYTDRAAAETAGSGVEIVALQDRAELRRSMVTAAGDGTVGLDARTVPHADWTQLSKDLELASIDSLIGTARETKDDAEIERIEAAARAADAALAEVEPLLFGTVDEPVTEADIRDELEYRMRRNGADDRSYDTIVATGPDHAARPHHEVGRRVIVEGDTVVIDVGGLVDGYHSDMTRSYVIGEPTAQQREIYSLVQASQAAGLGSLRGGVDAQTVDRACREVFDDAGYASWFIHGTGHGVGLLIHEAPFESPTSHDIVRAGNVVTIEPGLYRGGFGGIRIEDLVVVTADGHRVLTHHPQRPFDN